MVPAGKWLPFFLARETAEAQGQSTAPTDEMRWLVRRPSVLLLFRRVYSSPATMSTPSTSKYICVYNEPPLARDTRDASGGRGERALTSFATGCNATSKTTCRPPETVRENRGLVPF